MAKNLELALRITAKDTTGAALGKTRAGIESISKAARQARDAFIAWQASVLSIQGLRGLADLADQVQSINARLRTVTKTTEEFAAAQNLAYRVAAQTGAGYESIARLYTRLAQTASDYGLTQERIGVITEATARALQLSGASGAEAASVITQLSQALGSGVLRGEEFNSIMENGGRLAKALADGLGLPIGRLRALAEQGLLTTEVVSQAIESQRETLEREAAAMPRTIGQALSGVRDQFGRLVDEMNQSAGATRVIAAAFDVLGANLRTALGAAAVAGAAALGVALARLTISAKEAVAATVAKIAAQRQAIATDIAHRQAVLAYAQAELAAAQAAVARATGMARLAVVQNTLIPAQQRLAAAQLALNGAMAAGGVVARGLSVALGFLGGPLGIILTLLSAGATAWAIWGGRAESAADKARAAVDRAREASERLRKEQQFGTGDTGTFREAIVGLEKREELLRFSRGPGARAELESVQKQLAEFRQNLSESEARDKGLAPGAPTELGKGLLALAKLKAKMAPKGRGGGRSGIEADNSIDILRQRLNEEFTLLQEYLRLAEDSYERAYANQLIGIDDYYRARADIAARGIDEEIRRNEQLIAAQASRKPKDANDARKIEADIAELQRRNVLLGAQKAAQEAKFADEAARAKRELDDQLAAVRDELASITGTGTPEQRRAAIERQYREMVGKLQGDTQGAGLVRQLIDVKAAEAEFRTLESQWSTAIERMRGIQESANIQRESGNIGSREAQRQIRAASEEAAATMETLLPQMQQFMAQFLPPDQVAARMQNLRNELDRAKIVIDDVAQTIQGALESGFERLWTDIVGGAKSAKDAFADFGKSVVSVINQIIAKKLSEELFSGMLGGSGGGLFSGFGKWFASLFHEGGVVGTPGGRIRQVSALAFAGAPRLHDGTMGLAPDEVPAILQRGETVLPRGVSPSMQVVQNFSFSGPVNRATEMQIAAAAASGLARARQRNG